jgi:hypothetical protein
MHEQQMATFTRQMNQAQTLFEKDDLSSQEFVTALIALAQVTMYVLSTEDHAPWQREIQCYKDLYHVFLAEVPELEEPEEKIPASG